MFSLYDMLRYHKFTIGSIGIPEYGDPDKEIDFKNLLKYF
jgi:prolyl oligopeptidase